MRYTLRLDPPIQLYVPHLDDFMDAHFLTDYGIEYDDLWKGPMRKTGEWWTFTNDKVRAVNNITLGRGAKKPETK